MNQQELIASLNVENKPQLSLANSITLPGRSLAVVCVCNDLEPDQSGQMRLYMRFLTKIK